MNISVSARVHQDDGPRVVHLTVNLPELPAFQEHDITPEQLEALLQHSMTHDITDAHRPKLDVRTLDKAAQMIRYQKSMVRGETDCTSCAICLADFRPRKHVRRLPCGHLYCSACVTTWLSNHNAVCPTCRAEVV